MGAELLRPQGGTQIRHPAGEVGASRPAKFGRKTNLPRYTRNSRRHNIDNFTSLDRSRRRNGISGTEDQMVVKVPVKNLVMEEVTILKRGEKVRPDRRVADSRASDRMVETSGDDIALCSTDRLGPDPEILPKEMRIVERKSPLYAGSGFFTSPSPRSLPLPTSFFAKKEVASTTDLATRGLRYLLRLDLP